MRIAQIAPLIEAVPPMLYGGTERIVSYLTEELVRQDHAHAHWDRRLSVEWSGGARTTDDESRHHGGDYLPSPSA